MQDGERIDLYALCLNEARIIPHFMAHYAGLANRLFILDNGSTDGGLDLLAGDPRVSIRPFETVGDSFVDLSRRLLNNVWKASRGVADWVVVVEMDEHLQHADLRAYLAHCRRFGVTAVRAIGYQMTADAFPAGPPPLWRSVVAGARDATFDKLAIFRPDALTETNFHAGRHRDEPEGDVVLEPNRQVKLLHYKNLGADYVCERNEILARGLRPRDATENWGSHYRRGRDVVEREVRELRVRSRRVPGLPKRFPLDLTMDDERLALEESGLFDVRHYTMAYPGVASRSGTDALGHFCAHGWREGRRPNACFDPRWYLATYAAELSPEVNPLLDYALAGERAGRAPAPHFDPELYRHQHGLSSTESPLRHFLDAQASPRSVAVPTLKSVGGPTR
jgi:hypothetical protein